MGRSRVPDAGAPRRFGLEAALFAAAALLAVAAAGRFVAVEADQLSFPYAVNYGEGVVLDQAHRIATGEGLYRPLGRPAAVVDNYTPLYPWLASLALPGSKVSFAGGRFLSLVAALATAALIYGLVFVRRERDGGMLRPAAAGLLGGGLFLAAEEALTWGALYRVDCLGVALSVAGFALAAGGLRWGPLIAAPVFVASLAVRQSLIAAPLVAYLAIFLRDRRAALIGGGAFAVLAGVGVAVGALATGGLFLTHVVHYNVLPFDAGALWVKYLRPLLTQKPALIAAAAVALIALRRDRAALPFFFWAAAELCFGLTIGRKGADMNYLLLPIAALAALAARGAASAPRAGQRVAIAGLATLQLILSLSLERPRVGAADRAAIAARDGRILERIATIDGPILFEEPSLALLAGRRVEFEPFMATQLAAIGVWDPAPLVAAIDERRYAAVQRTAWLRSVPGRQPMTIWFGDRTVPAVAAALDRRYAERPGERYGRPVAPSLTEAYVLWFPSRAGGD